MQLSLENLKMSNELIINADGTITCVGDAGSVSGIIAEAVKAATIPAEVILTST